MVCWRVAGNSSQRRGDRSGLIAFDPSREQSAIEIQSAKRRAKYQIPQQPQAKATTMETQSAEQLTKKKCLPCEGGVDACQLDFSVKQLEQLNGWYLTEDKKRIRRDWTVTNFMEAMRFFGEVAKIAEDDAHHPDLHLVGYRNMSIELWTHAIDGLSENDFILAAKIDQLLVVTKG